MSNLIYNIEVEKKKVLEEVRSIEPGFEAIKRLQYVREHMDWAIEGYRNSLTILSDTTYEDRKHFLMELIQNADDADYGDKVPEIHFFITDEGLELYYNESGFTVEDIISITDTGASTKKSKKSNSTSFIGEKGIGFKSVFAMAETVEIQSGPWHFMLEKDECIIPKPIKSHEIVLGTRQKIKFINPNVTEEIFQELKRYVSGEVETFIYLQKISRFVLVDKRTERDEKHEIEILPADRSGDRLVLRQVATGVEREFLMYSETVHFSKELVAGRWEKIGTSMGSVERKVVLAASLNSEDINDSGRLFCYLPTSVSLPIPVYMQIDGVTKADREKLHDPYNNSWNAHLLYELPDIIAHAIAHWAQIIESPDVLQRLVPVADGNDQLNRVFLEGRIKLKHTNWVKVMSDKPKRTMAGYVVGLPPYLSKILFDYPELRKEFSGYLNKYILDYEWNKSKKLMKKLRWYDFEMASPLKILGALSQIDLPDEIKNNPEKLLEYYRFILDLIDFKFDEYRNPSELLLKTIMEHVRELKIFPITGEGFSALGSNPNVYYSLSDTKPTYTDIRLIDANYLDKNNLNKKNHEELTESEQIAMNISTTLTTLIKRVGVKDLTDDIVLVDFIIPELKSDDDFSLDGRLNKFYNVFVYYKNKVSEMKDYSRVLNGIEDIYLFDDKMKLHKLKNMLIPKVIRISPSEDVYDPYELEEIYLSPSFLDRISEQKNLFHKFLIEVGIRHKPVFKTIKEDYPDVGSFRREDPERSEMWSKRIRKDYTFANKVTVERVVLDEIDQKILRAKQGENDFEKYLYSSWINRFEGNEINDATYHYRGQPIPGYFTVNYKRNEKRCIQLKDLDWAGVKPRVVPVRTIEGSVFPSSEIRVLPNIPQMRLRYLYEYLNGVLKDNKNNLTSSYNELYLDSLEILDLKFQDMEVLWKRVPESRFEDIIELIIEMLHQNIPYSNIRVMDKRIMTLVELDKFRLGKTTFEDSPLIEMQYGEVGKKLGELVGLAKEGTVDSYKNIISTVLREGVLEEAVKTRFTNLLSEWYLYRADEKMVIIDEFNSSLGSNKPPILVLGELELYNNLKNNKINCIFIPKNNIDWDRKLLDQAAKEIGFILPDSLGELELVSAEPISKVDFINSNQILEKYIGLLEGKEVSRLNYKLKAIGGISKVLSHITFAESAFRQEKNSRIHFNVELPHLDSNDKKIILKKNLNEYDVIKAILLLTEFAPRRNVEQDLKEIKTNLVNEAQEQERFEKENQIDIIESEVNVEKIQNGHSRKSFRDTMGFKEQGEDKNRQLIRKTRMETQDQDVDVITDIGEVASRFKANLIGKEVDKQEVRSSWKLGPNPEEEIEIRESLINGIADSLNQGPEVYRKKLRSIRKKERIYNGNLLEENEVLVDKDVIDPRAFLEAEYESRCQVCGKQMIFDSGKKWVNVYHIQDKKDGAWYYNRPFNFLGLCPTCYTWAKHSGNRDFSQLVIEAQNVIEGETFAEPVKEFSGDYYLVDVKLDNTDYQMKLSKVHMNYFAALIESEDLF